MIARAADVGAGTIYRYFANKEVLINELYDHVQKELHEATMKDIPAEISVRDEFYRKWRNILQYFLDNPEQAQFLEQYSTSPFLSDEVQEQNQKRNAHLKVLRARGIEGGDIRDVSYQTIVIYMWGTIKQIHAQHTAGLLPLTDGLIDEIYEVFWEGIRARP